ncbi:MAG: hypothetical protein A3F54_02100 [Candidatus Kerfeldbacteria bacterium RIFCSPHIGHO2_12_FULL_48_17]|uniref:Type II secretion system protein GspF domain-containing protein n=1 Tax=Candidatus Kerfeldbacteria bacterium RIFCSPHIGHO2_12_FULL_48_17 TaxID=1798542 RepID=A0A1G2AZM8_9BACT|nr:MAG: hypothetical protein A3F54_02100 [Candidatus Kerfeldbacteria bacterium RIFCSPHIGHO2_12_FULL_48_17]
MPAETQEQPKEKPKKHSFHIGGVSSVDLLFFVQNLEIMVRTGFAIADALGVIAPQVKRKMMREALVEIHGNVEKGKTLATSLEQFPRIFPDLLVQMVAAGEASGQLDITLKQITLQLKKTYTLKKKITNALIYPAVILIAMVLVGTGLVIFVLPKVLSLFENGEFDVPLPTRILLAIAHFFENNGLLAAIVFVALIIFFIISLRISSGKKFWQAVLLRTPVVSKILIEIQLARFFRTISSLLATDIPIVESFKILHNIQPFYQYKKIIFSASSQLQQGKTIHESLNQNAKLFPPQTVQMMRVGEESGTLDEITKEVADFYEGEVDNTMSNLTVIIEPALMVFLGLGVAFIAVSIIMPIYSLANQV